MNPVRPTAMCTVIHPALVFTAASTVLVGFLFTYNVGLLALRITISFEKKLFLTEYKLEKFIFLPKLFSALHT